MKSEHHPRLSLDSLRICGSALGKTGTPRHPELLLVYDPKSDVMAWIHAATLKIVVAYPHWRRRP